MASKRLSLEDIQRMKTMVQKGVAPEDIAKHFNIAISSVHNYKNRFKSEGMSFPIVRGKRPTGSVDIQSKEIGKTSDKPGASNIKKTSSMESSMNFVVNGVTVHVSAEAKEVNITKNNIEVNF